MISVDLSSIAFKIDESKLLSLNVRAEDEARDSLAGVWDEDRESLVNFLSVFYPNNGKSLSKQEYFVTLAFVKHGYVPEDGDEINVKEVKKQILDDLNVLNREAGWTDDEKVFFENFWPDPVYSQAKKQMDFGLSLKDNNNKTINKTLNRFLLTRYGHIELNLSILNNEIGFDRPLSFYLEVMNTISGAITIMEPLRYIDIDYDNDMPSKSALVHLVLSAEKF